MAQGIVDFIALVYYHTHLGGQFKNLLWRGVSKAERELAGDDSYLVRVDFEVEPVPEVNFERALEKFDRRKMGDMTAGEAQAIVHLLRRSSSISHADLEEAREEMAEWAEEAAEDQQNASRESTISKREQQADRLEDPEE